MKNLFYLIVITHFLVCCKNKEIETFQGPPGPNEGDTSIYNTDHYRLTKIVNFSKSDSQEPHGYVQFTYDAQGNLIREAMYDMPDVLFTYKAYTYRNGHMETKKVYGGVVNSLTLSTTSTYTYEGDLLIQEDILDDTGTLLRSIHWVYANRKLVETYTWSQSLGKHHNSKYTYDGRGNVVKMQEYMYDNELSNTENYTYDDRNRLIRTERFDHQNALELITIKEYAGNNTLPSSEMHQNAAGNVQSGRKYEFDVAGNQTSALIGTNIVNKRKYYGKLLREEILYSPVWGFTEVGMNRYEYEKK
jgi:YD repeat-containing protein